MGSSRFWSPQYPPTFTVKPSTDECSATKMTAPSMKERKVCWEARDEYWKCLDESMEDAFKCEKLRCCFVKACPQQWVKYFDKRRDYLKYKAELETGKFQPSETTKTS